MSTYLKALMADDALPLQDEASNLWLKNLKNPLRWVLFPVFQFVFSILLHIIWLFKRLPLPQFSAHISLQKLICFFCRNFVSVEANLLILRHYATESNILNFLISNSDADIATIDLYPKNINEMMECSFVDHDQELFRVLEQGGLKHLRKNTQSLSWDGWQPINMQNFQVGKKWTQILDFETAHALFMCVFCFMLKREEYRDAINGFNFDQSIGIKVAKLIKDDSVLEYAYNRYPLLLVGPTNLSYRFMMHGFFTEHLYSTLELLRLSEASVHKELSIGEIKK